MDMSVLQILLNQLARAGQADMTKQPLTKSTTEAAGADHAVTFWQTNDLSGAAKLAVSVRHGESNAENKEESKSITQAVQKLLVDEGVDTRFVLNFLAFEKSDKRVSLHASEGSLTHYINAHRGAITGEQIKDIFAQTLLGIKAFHEKNLVHRDVATRNFVVF